MNSTFEKGKCTYKIYNTDCYDFLLNNKIKVDCAIIDPPYILNLNGCSVKGISKRIKARNKQLLDLSKGFNTIIFDYIRQAQDKTNIFCFCSEKQLIEILKYAEDKKLIYNILIWYKINPPPLFNNTFLPDTEYIVYMRERGRKINTNYELAKKIFISEINISDKKKYKHPTIKPIALINKLIQIGSNENEIILDCFMGSGTTGISAINLKRNFIGIEKEKKYFEIAKERIEDKLKKLTIFE